MSAHTVSHRPANGQSSAQRAWNLIGVFALGLNSIAVIAFGMLGYVQTLAGHLPLWLLLPTTLGLGISPLALFWLMLGSADEHGAAASTAATEIQPEMQASE